MTEICTTWSPATAPRPSHAWHPIATPTPTATLPNGTHRKNVATSPALFSAPFAISFRSEKTTIAVPSFTSDSPSMMCPKRLLAPTSFSSATTATGSVALRMLPSIRLEPQPQSYGSVALSSAPTSAVPIRTPGPASHSTCVAHRRKVCHSSENALSKTSAGRNTASIVCGPMSTQMSSESPSAPRSTYECRNPSARPTNRSATVYGRRECRVAPRASAPSTRLRNRK